MRVIAGKYKGHKLVDFKASHIRPTTDRVKETLFNILYPYLENATVCDLFSGTGSLGIEALSRGCLSVQFVENHPRSKKILMENLKKLNISKGWTIQSEDAFKFVKNYQSSPFHIIIIDPPFTKKYSHLIMQEIEKSSLVDSHSLISIESAKQELLLNQYGQWIQFKKRSFGDKILSLFISEKSTVTF